MKGLLLQLSWLEYLPNLLDKQFEVILKKSKTFSKTMS